VRVGCLKAKKGFLCRFRRRGPAGGSGGGRGKKLFGKVGRSPKRAAALRGEELYAKAKDG